MNRTKWFSTLLLASCLTACQVKRPDTILADAKMEKVLYDFHIAKAMAEEVPYNESYKKVLYLESAYKKNGITKAEFDSSLVWFAHNPEVLAKIYEKVNLRLKAERDGINHLIAIRDNKPKTSVAGDSVEVWVWQNRYRLTGMPLNNKIAFILPSDSNFQNRDTLSWSVRFRFPNGAPDSTYAPLMALQIQYENDSIIGKTQTVRKTGSQTITLMGDSIGAIKEIRGFIYYPQQQSTNVLLADRISLMRYHATDTLSVAAKDSLQADATKKDSIEKKSPPPEPTIIKTQGTDSLTPARREIRRPRPVMKGSEGR